VLSSLNAIYQKCADGGYIAFVEEIPGANTQGTTLDEARANLREAVQLIVEVNRNSINADLEGVEVIRESLAV
jgi:predicted RNase H-like HicB family nuclease